MSAIRDNALVWIDAPRVDDALLDRLGDLYVRNSSLQQFFQSFERFLLWWEEREQRKRLGVFADHAIAGRA
jgi:hypothetical protein